MKSEIIQFRTATTQESMTNAVRVLNDIEGVGEVTPSLIRNEVSVQFNADLTSKQNLQNALVNAGYVIQTVDRTAGCGGGGGGCTCS